MPLYDKEFAVGHVGHLAFVDRPGKATLKERPPSAALLEDRQQDGADCQGTPSRDHEPEP